ncbi:hypothetical protein HYS92_02155 [Candidatus Daviesbacteria bacterium]|nr:hypothetical protein [Candidatus Daviesbacteria bacterium]
MKDSVMEIWGFIHQPDFSDWLVNHKGQVARKLLLLGGLGIVTLFGFKTLKDTYNH